VSKASISELMDYGIALGPTKGDRVQVSLIREPWIVIIIVIHDGSLGCVLDCLLDRAMQSLTPQALLTCIQHTARTATSASKIHQRRLHAHYAPCPASRPAIADMPSHRVGVVFRLISCTNAQQVHGNIEHDFLAVTTLAAVLAATVRRARPGTRTDARSQAVQKDGQSCETRK
jgi:hypothetical protein